MHADCPRRSRIGDVRNRFGCGAKWQPNRRFTIALVDDERVHVDRNEQPRITLEKRVEGEEVADVRVELRQRSEARTRRESEQLRVGQFGHGTPPRNVFIWLNSASNAVVRKVAMNGS